MKKYIQNTLLLFALLATVSCLKEDDRIISIPPILGDIVTPPVGGAAQPNQVWVDLSNPDDVTRSKATHRAAWDLGFYSGDEFRVVLNYSILMAAAPIESNNIDAVSAADFSNLVQILTPGAALPEIYIDNVKGDYLNNGTAISEISANDAENKVYLLKLGYQPYIGTIPPNSAYTTGDSRGFKKVRILRNDANSYKIQYADLNDTTHQEFIITKEPDYNFTFFSLETESLADIQPPKQEWDLCFTVWNNTIEGHGTYIYADFIIQNKLAGVGSYQIITDPLTVDDDFDNFTAADVNEAQFIYDDQRAIGSNWRSTVTGTTSNPVVEGDRFYIVKDPDGILFKIRFLSMLGENNERGHPQFEFEPL